MVLQVITFSFEAFTNFFSATSVWLKITILLIFWFYWEITGRNLIWTHSFDRKLVKSWFGKRNMSDSAPGTWFSLQRSYTIQSDFGSNCATESQWTSSQWNCLFTCFRTRIHTFSFLKDCEYFPINGWKSKYMAIKYIWSWGKGQGYVDSYIRRIILAGDPEKVSESQIGCSSENTT